MSLNLAPSQVVPAAHRPLLAQLRWFVRLRWIAGLAVLMAASLDWQWLAWGRAYPMLAMGALILSYNLALSLVMRRPPAGPKLRGFLLVLAWAQILLDVGSLTLLTLWTGGAHSPLAGLFVLHMVFASLLLPRSSAYAGALVAMSMLYLGLIFTGQWPTSQPQLLEVLGWGGALLLTVYVANHMTRSLRSQSRHLRRKNRRIRAMTEELRRQQSALLQHEKMIAMGQMAAGVAHEVANPLASMDSLLQLALRKPERLNLDTVKTLREQVQRINTIVQQMTSFAHPSDSQWELASVNEVVERALRMLHLDARFRKVQLDFITAPEVSAARIQAHAVQQVVVNLVINALDAMAEVQSPRLVIRTGRDGDQVTIEVSDNGHGIRPEHMDRLFEPFFTTKPVGKGTGLGLSITYSLVKRQGGQIKVRSQPGKGATFVVYLPAAAPAPTPPPVTSSAH